MLTPQELTTKKRIIYALIALGFAGLIGAHEITPADENADFTLPLIVAGIGTASFVVAGLMARKLMKQLRSR
jgi:tellurite resistance protein TehA-like permease